MELLSLSVCLSSVSPVPLRHGTEGILLPEPSPFSPFLLKAPFLPAAKPSCPKTVRVAVVIGGVVQGAA